MANKRNREDNFLFYIILILAIVLFESIAQYHIRKSKSKHNSMYILVAMLSYGVVCLLLNKCYDFNGIGITNFVWSILSIISMLTIGYLVFQEEITKFDIIGIFFCIIGLYFIFIYGHH